MATQNPDIEDIINKAAEAGANLKDDMFGAQDNAKSFFKTVGNSTAQVKELFTTYTKIKDVINDTTALYARLGSSYISAGSIQKDVYKTTSLISEQSAKILNLATKQGFVIRDEDAVLQALNNKRRNGEEEIMFRLLEQKKTLQANLITQKELFDILPQANDEYVKMNLKVSALGKAFSFISKIPVLGQFVRFDIISKEFLVSFSAGFKAIGTQLVGLLKNPVVNFLALAAGMKALISGVMQMDKSVTTLSNNLGVSKESANAIFKTFTKTSIEGNKLVEALDKGFLSVRNLASGTLELQNSLETNALFTDRMVQSQVLMTKQMGLSAEEAAGVQKFSLLTGKSADSILQNAIKQNTAAISYRKIIKEVSTISAELSMRFGNDPEKIAKAVVQANKLGMSLEETRKISSSLLNFEQSIEGELESELLLGRQFNFEKARELALMGKSSEAAGEILGQIGGINALEKMNVIQRERIAAAIGLSSDELSKAAREQAVLNALGEQNKDALAERYELLRKSNDQAGIAKLQEDARKIQGGEIVLQDIARANLSQRFEESLNRIKDSFIGLALPLSGLLDGLAKMLEHTFVLKGLLITAAAVSGIFAGNMIRAALATAFATGGISLIPALLGVGALAATKYAVNDFQEKPDGTVIMSPAGTFKPNKKDYITASTNPPFQGGGGGDDSAMMSKMDQLIYHVAAGKMIKYDTITAGTAHGMSYNSYA
jgi:hypothetical protein